MGAAACAAACAILIAADVALKSRRRKVEEETTAAASYRICRCRLLVPSPPSSQTTPSNTPRQPFADAVAIAIAFGPTNPTQGALADYPTR